MSREYRKIDVTGGILTGEELYTLAYIRAALSFQRLGMKWSRNVPMGTTLARKMLGLKGRRESLYKQVDDIIVSFGGESLPEPVEE
tara:strand:+ start:7374 stop:7631 length:258 start_codon:yes stop_codon:yes gene_type:complete